MAFAPIPTMPSPETAASGIPIPLRSGLMPITSFAANPSRGSFRRMTEWTLRLIGTGIDGQSRSFDVTAISRPEGLGDIANLGLTLAEAKSCWCKSYRSGHDLPINGRSRGHRWEKKEDPEF
jgi:hypothetical protein